MPFLFDKLSEYLEQILRYSKVASKKFRETLSIARKFFVLLMHDKRSLYRCLQDQNRLELGNPNQPFVSLLLADSTNPTNTRIFDKLMLSNVLEQLETN